MKGERNVEGQEEKGKQVTRGRIGVRKKERKEGWREGRKGK